MTRRGAFLLALALWIVTGGVLPARAANPPPRVDLVLTVVRAGTLTRFLAVLRATDQVELLRGSLPFTVFAPDDEAFEKLPAGTLDTLLKPENKGRLTALLAMHLVRGKSLGSKELLLTSDKPLAFNDHPLTITRGEDGTVSVDGARIVRPDLAATNGTLHILDKVLMPASW